MTMKFNNYFKTALLRLAEVPFADHGISMFIPMVTIHKVGCDN